MKRKRSAKLPVQAKSVGMDAQAIDALYGLEPVYEPGAASEPTQFVTVSCPYCGESYTTSIDLANGSCTYVEDCQICCQAMELAIELNDAGDLQSFQARRLD